MVCKYHRIHSEVYCISNGCTEKYSEVCDQCLGQQGQHAGHQYIYGKKLDEKLWQEKEELTKKLIRSRSISNIKEEVTGRFADMRAEILKKLNACQNLIFDRLENDAQPLIRSEKVEEILQKLNQVHKDSPREVLISTARKFSWEILERDVFVESGKLLSIVDSVFGTIEMLEKSIEALRQSFIEAFDQINLEILKPIHFDGDVRKENRLDFKGNLIKQLSEHTHHVNKLIKINSKVFASASSDKTIMIWNPFQSIKPIVKIVTQEKITSLEKLNQSLLISGGPSCQISVWNWKRKLLIRVIKDAHDISVDTLRRLDNGQIISGGCDSYIRIWNINSGSLAKKIKTTSPTINSIDTIDQSLIVCGSSEQKVAIWDIQKSQLVSHLVGHLGQVIVVKVLSQEIIASGGSDQLLKLWKWKEEKEYRSFSGHKAAIYTIVKLGQHEIASGSIDCNVRIWNWSRSECMLCFHAHNQTVTCVLSLSSKCFATASDDSLIKVWN